MHIAEGSLVYIIGNCHIYFSSFCVTSNIQFHNDTGIL